MDTIMFRYFRQPHEFSTFSKTPKICDLCGKSQPGYNGPFYGRNSVQFVCEQCIIEGKLAEKNSFTNEGNFNELLVQLESKVSEFSKAEIEKMAKAKDDELTHRTPHVITWQDFIWPVHCGDYCCFLKEVGQPELLAIAPEGQVHRLFESNNDDNFNDWWPNIRPDAPKDNTTAYSVGVYLFQCLNCQEYVVLWDCD
jgi:uncharacterized protein CbrC (UPF0167 family)